MPKPKKQKEEEPADELMKLSASELNTHLDLLKEKCHDLKLKRNYIQMDRDMVEQYFKNAENEISNLKTEITNKETEAETTQRNHNVEIKLYLQRVKHLQFQQQRSNMEIERDGENAKNKENQYFDKRVGVQNSQKQDFKKKTMVHQKKYIEEVSFLESHNKSKQELLRENYARELQQIQRKYQLRLVQLKQDLDLKLKVEIHEVEERKNLHINELMKNHEEAFRQLKAYYNDITSDNLKLIREHKAEIKRMNDTADANRKTIAQLRTSNGELEGPLEALRKQHQRLKSVLKQFDKHKMSLGNYKSKYHVLMNKLSRLEKESAELNQKLSKIQDDKKGLQRKFSTIAEEVKQNANVTNKTLNERLKSMIDHLEEKEGQLQQVIQQASLDYRLVGQISSKVQETIKDKNQYIKTLRYGIDHATKAYNDAVRVYEAKLVEFGVPAEELGFQPLDTLTSTMPAGLVAS